jgi:hypothetical protein
LLGVVHPIHKNFNSHVNNWFNCKPCSDRQLSRLDRFYLSHKIKLDKLHPDYWVHVDYSTNLSNHFPGFCLLSFSQTIDFSSQIPFKLNISHLKNDECVSALVGIQNLIPKPLEGESCISWWSTTISQCVEFLWSFGRRMSWKHKCGDKSLQG